MLLAEWHKTYPEAQIIGMKGLQEKVKKEDWEFSGGESYRLLVRISDRSHAFHRVVYGIDPDDTKYGFQEEIQAVYVYPLTTLSLFNPTSHLSFLTSQVLLRLLQTRRRLVPHRLQNPHRRRPHLQPPRQRAILQIT